MKKKIVVIGSSNIDLMMKMDRLPEKGETITDAAFMQVYGGKGANQAVGAARAGGEVAFVNCVGSDAYTPQMVKNFQADGIDTRFVFEEEDRVSGHALIMIGSEGHNYLSVAPGANYALTSERIDEARPVIEEAALILMQYEIPAETIKYVIELASKKNIPVLWNFAPAREFDRTYLDKIDILVVNEVEAGFLAGIKVEDRESAKIAAQKLLDQGARIAIVTLGSEGSVLHTRDTQISLPAFKVYAIDTTSAGDVFCGAFAVAYIEGKSLEESLRFATAASAICVMRLGAQPSAPMRREIDAFLAERQENKGFL